MSFPIRDKSCKGQAKLIEKPRRPGRESVRYEPVSNESAAMRANRGEPVIVIRADASQTIGGGHIMRCLTLAAALQERARIIFLSNTLPVVLAERIRQAGHGHIVLDETHIGDGEVSAEAAVGALKEQGISLVDVLIVDHYRLSAPWMERMRAIAGHIVVIDELADRSLDCDALVAPSLGLEAFESAYRQCVPSGCRLMLGVRYSFVASAFRVLRDKALERRSACWPLSRILISTGFSDVGGAAVIAARALAGSSWQVAVAIGSAAASIPALQSLARRTKNIVLLQDCDDMAEEMLKADIMIGAPGTTSWERATLALPSLLVITADNQRDIARALDAAGAAKILGEATDLKAECVLSGLARLSGCRNFYHAMSTAASTLCDGYGAERVADMVLELAEC